ncbi:MAG: methyl-accepting chemotaxis protein [Chloroflexi bacterium]|nr:methyl-accepting chemotaxis protein [Chloroflexota bacterium]
MPWLNERSIRTKLLSAFLLLGLVPMLAVSVFAYRSAERTVIDAAGQRVEDVAFQAIDKLDRNLFERYGDVQAYALSAPARSMEPERIAAWIDTMMGVYSPIYKLMIVADAQGHIVAVNSVDLDGKPLPTSQALLQRDVSGERWYREAMAGQIKDTTALVEDLHHDDLMRAVYGESSGADLALSFSAPIKDVDGRIVGVWTNRFNWDVATQILKEVQDRARRDGMETMRLGLLSLRGLPLIHDDAAQILQASPSADQRATLARAAPTGHRDGVSTAGDSAVMAGWANSAGYASYPGLSWVATSSQSRDEVLAPAMSLGAALAGALAVAVAVICTVSWLVARVLVRQINRVGAVASRLAEGDLRETVDAESADEIGKMATAMSRMVRYQRQMAAVADAVAAGDLAMDVEPQSEHDALSIAFREMVGNLRELLGEVTATADRLAGTSTELGQTAARTGDVVQQVSRSIQQVVGGVSETSQSAHHSNAAVGQLTEAIDSVARGAMQQAHQVQTASGTSARMAASVQQMAATV